MTALWIALGVIAGLAVVGLLPIHVYVDYEQRELLAYARFGPIRYSLLADTPKKVAKKEARLARLRHADGRGDSDFDKLITEIKDYATDLQDLLYLWPVLPNAVCIDRFQLHVLLTDSDPADLALHYGGACAALGGVVAVIANLLPLKNVDVEPECSMGETKYDFFAHIRLTINVAHGVHVLWKYLLHKSAEKRSKKAMLQPERKGE